MDNKNFDSGLVFGDLRSGMIDSQVEWQPVPQNILDMAWEIIERHHEHLRAANIAIIFRGSGTTTNGKLTIGKAAKVPAHFQHVFNKPVDFLIWLAKDVWDDLRPEQRRALIDHELCHCSVGKKGFALRGHDVEEFTEIVERHGLWQPELRQFAQEAQQYELPFSVTEKRGAVVTFEGQDATR